MSSLVQPPACANMGQKIFGDDCSQMSREKYYCARVGHYFHLVRADHLFAYRLVNIIVQWL